MKMSLMAVLAAGLASGTAHGEGVYAGYKGSATVEVGEGQVEVRAPAFVDVDGAIYKNGPGELQIPLAAIWQNLPFTAYVREGMLSFTDEPAPTFETPTATLDKAAFWVDAAKGLVVSNETYVYEWNDAREDAAKAGAYDAANPVTGRRYLYAKAQWDRHMPLNAFYGIGPSLVTRSEKSMLYFNGQGKSGQFMRWMNPDGTRADVTGITDLFVVLDCQETFGPFISPGTDPNDMQTGYNSNLEKAMYFSNAGNSALAMHDNAVFCRDGERANVTTYVSRGLQVLDFRFEFGRKPHAGVFFGERPDKLDDSSVLSGREGGDYIAEAIVFTNLLSAAERMQVQQYLLRKYGKVGHPSVRVAVADDAQVALPVEAGATSQLGGDVQISGNGRLTKRGEGLLVVGQETALNRSLALDAGSLRLRRPVSIDVAAGDTVTASAPTGVSAWSAGTEVTRTPAAGSDKVTKTGAGLIQVDRIPDGVKSVEVNAGMLSLGVSRTGRSAVIDPVYPTNVTRTAVTIANWSFEDAEGVYRNSGINYIIRTKTATKALDWWCKLNADSDLTNGGGGFCSTILTKDDHSQGGGPNWPTGGYDAPDGKWVFCLKGDMTAWTFVTVEKAGEYELTFQTGARADTHDIEVHLVGVAEGDDVTVSEATKVGTVSAQKDPFRRQLLMVSLQPGRTAICFRTPTTNKDRVVAIDDVHLTMFEREFGKVPNGDFEWTVGEPTTTTRETQLVGWEIDTEGTFPDSAKYASVTPCVTDSRHSSDMPRFYPSEDALYGKMGLLFCSTGGVVRTTFTPPAGTWRLRCRARRWSANTKIMGDYPYAIGWLRLSAVMKSGSQSTPLGEISQGNHFMEVKTWTTPFTSDGKSPLTLELRQTMGIQKGEDLGCGVVDDLDLVEIAETAADGDELIANGSFETDAIWTYDQNATVSGNTNGKSASQAFAGGTLWGAAEGFDGKQTWRVTQLGQVTQPLTIPEDGIYRLSFRTLSRHDGLDKGFDPIRVWLEANGEKTVIARTEVVTTNFCTQVFYVRLKAGDYTFGLQGENDVSVTGFNDRSSLVDCVSLRRAEWMDGKTPTVPENLEVRVAEGAKLSLDFGGQLTLGRLKLGGRAVSGEISAAKRPDLAPYLSGSGEVYVEPRGMVLILR